MKTWSAILVAVVAVACKGSPAAPTPTGLTITSPNTNVFIGEAEQFTATTALSNGTTQPATGVTWSTDATTVASVSPAGSMTALTSGEVNVIANAGGVGGSKRMRVLPNYAGTWSGTYTVTGCTQTGQVALANICGAIGSAPPYRWAFTQSGTGVVSGSFFLGSVAFDNVSASIPLSGNISVAGRNVTSSTLIDATWQINIPRASTVNASVSQVWTSTSLSGQININGSLATVNRTAGMSLFSRVPRSLSDALAAIVER